MFTVREIHIFLKLPGSSQRQADLISSDLLHSDQRMPKIETSTKLYNTRVCDQYR